MNDIDCCEFCATILTFLDVEDSGLGFYELTLLVGDELTLDLGLMALAVSGLGLEYMCVALLVDVVAPFYVHFLQA